MAMNITKENFAQEVLQASQTVLADFWAPWCGPCQKQGPILESFAQAHPDIKVIKVNVDEEPELAGEFGIEFIPSLIVFKAGQITKASSGLHAVSDLEELVK